MLKVYQLQSIRSPHGVAPNQFEINDSDKNIQIFQSYNSTIACIDYNKKKITVDPWYSGYSQTTTAYFNRFMSDRRHEEITNNFVQECHDKKKKRIKLDNGWTLSLKDLN